MKAFLVTGLLALALLLSGCAGLSARPSAAAAAPATAAPAQGLPEPGENLTRVDEQGAVIVEVTPQNLSAASDELEFDVAMNTHSVDLSMDLAALSTLSTDTGVTLGAASWDGPRGGHHVRGTLIFPATNDGASILANATRLTLTIRDVGVPVRVFEWALK